MLSAAVRGAVMVFTMVDVPALALADALAVPLTCTLTAAFQSRPTRMVMPCTVAVCLVVA